jgi:hypothetical protein
MKNWLIKLLGGHTKEEYCELSRWADAEAKDLSVFQYVSDAEMMMTDPAMFRAFSDKRIRDMVQKIAAEMLAQNLIVVESRQSVDRMGGETWVRARVLKPNSQ